MRRRPWQHRTWQHRTWHDGRLRRRPLVVVATSVAAAIVIGVTSPSAARPSAVGAGRSNAADHAATLARAHGAALGLTGEQGLTARDVVVDPSGAHYVHFDRTFRGLPVVGGDFIVESNGNGTYRGADGRTKDVSVPSITPRISSQAAASAARAAMSGTRTMGDAAYSVTRSVPRLAVYAVGRVPRLVWQTQVNGIGSHGEPAGQVVFVDALTGAVIQHWATVLSHQGTGRSLYLGTVPVTTAIVARLYVMVDNLRGGARTDDGNNGPPQISLGTLFRDADNIWGNGRTDSRQSAAVDANYGVAATWDFYRKTFGRRGIKNNGVGARSVVHVGTGWVNAAWEDACFCMRYGDGDGLTFGPLVSVDAAGHEMTHGVTSSTAHLLYLGESGGLNESTSDVMGTMVEFSTRNPRDPGDYMIGENLVLNGTKPLRFMDRPSKDGLSPDCWTPGLGNLDVHLSSGVGNHLFYLLSEGSGAKVINGISYLSPTCNRSKVIGIGRDKAAALWFRALTTKWVSTTNYAAARAGMLSAAATLYGGTRSREYVATARAWSAVGVR